MGGAQPQNAVKSDIRRFYASFALSRVFTRGLAPRIVRNVRRREREQRRWRGTGARCTAAAGRCGGAAVGADAFAAAARSRSAARALVVL
jgi:hypothetical protein